MSSLMQRLSDTNFDWSARDDNYQVDNRYIGYDTLEEEIENVDLLNEAWGTAIDFSGDQDEKTLAKICYTLQVPDFYRTCNIELRKWFKSQKNDKFPFNNYVKIMESQALKFTKKVVLWRGVSVTVKDKELDLIKKGRYVTSNQFFSCSIVKKTAQKFAKKGILFKFVTNFAIRIGEDSIYPDEEEYVIPPGMQFQVIDCRTKTENKLYKEIDLKLLEIKIACCSRADLVLDSTNFHVTLEKDAGKSTQRWFIQGRYIRSSHDGNVLDIDQPGWNKKDKIGRGHKICTWPLHCQSNQEWFFKEDNTIESGITPFVMDVDVGIREGAPLIVWTKNLKPNQLFQIIPLDD